MKKNLLVAQSGGPTAVINSTLAGVIKGGFDADNIDKVYGGVNGIKGIENEDIILLDKFRDEKELRLLQQTPSSYLSSCRKRIASVEEDPQFYEKIFKIFEKYNIGYFFYIGGNDSMDTADKLSGYAKDKEIDIKIIGIPKTIDNDLAITDHTPGYGSAAKFVANCARQLSLDTGVYGMSSVVILEIMGRNAGWLTAAAALANDNELCATDIVCLPERVFEIDSFLAQVERTSKIKKNIIIALSEGIKGSDGNYVSEGRLTSATREDSFAHATLGGVGKVVEKYIASEMGLKVRTMELSTLQRCYSAGASLCDVKEAFEVGYKGVEFALEGLTGIMPGFIRKNTDKYEIEIAPITVGEIANVEKKVPSSMISKDGFGVTEEFIKYASPLIQGEPELIYENGVIQFTHR